MVFLAPNDRTYSFNAMPFVPTNTPVFYTVIMRYLKDKEDKLSIIRVTALKEFQDQPITLTTANEIIIEGKLVI